MAHGGNRRGAGRPRGARNKATEDVKVFAQQLIDDPAYQAKLWQRWRAGELAPAMEQMVWQFRYGKPVERVEHSTPVPIRVRFVDA